MARLVSPPRPGPAGQGSGRRPSGSAANSRAAGGPSRERTWAEGRTCARRKPQTGRRRWRICDRSRGSGRIPGQFSSSDASTTGEPGRRAGAAATRAAGQVRAATRKVEEGPPWTRCEMCWRNDETEPTPAQRAGSTRRARMRRGVGAGLHPQRYPQPDVTVSWSAAG